ncbi:hydroxymethylglutaryl-CoA reductase [Pseudomonas sp. NPDC090233]|uniref:hydroxymethylglutaryl-CoA reductase n=1 Tax=Pseudomonas sp. NPDC090233 TaxID=3364479 RepID=UPI00383BB37F
MIRDGKRSIDLPKIPGKGDYSEDARRQRLSFLSQQTRANLDQVANIGFASEQVRGNIESLIGSVEVPVGVAGPLQINGHYAKGLFYGPLATTEGALVASVSRGAVALNRAGGVNAACLGERMLRVPYFELETLADALRFAEFVREKLSDLQAQVGKQSQHAKLVALEPQPLGRVVYVQFIYETADAAGQNMTTSCTWALSNYLRVAFRKRCGKAMVCHLVESNLSSDKKVSYQSFLRGRGVRVVVDCELPKQVVQEVLNTSPKNMVMGFNRAASGAVAAGTLGLNFNIANVIAALFTATGQDIACVHESSVGHLHMERGTRDSLYATLELPCLVIGTVGGGTGLQQQRQCLDLMGCAGDGGKRKLAEAIAGFCLGLELSILAAMVADEFTQAHDRLGRNRPGQ